jgi:YD repeat-containing protein
VVATPEEGPLFSRWLRVSDDDHGRVARVTDDAGSDIRIGYDQTGELASLSFRRGGIQITRNGRGHIQSTGTSWGDRQRNTYDPTTGALKTVELLRGNRKATIAFGPWRPSRSQQFDGSEVRITYDDRSAHPGQIKELHTPDGLVLRYDYDPTGRIMTVTYGAAYRLIYTFDAQGRMVGLTHTPARS